MAIHKNSFYIDLVSSEHYNVAKQINKTINILEIVGLQETAVSKLLAWLFNPNEGHNQNDLFIREFMKALWKSDQTLFKKTFNTNIVNLETCPLPEFIIQTECVVPDGRIDILFNDPINNVQIILENKFGAKESGNQFLTYEKYVKKYKSENTGAKILMVVMDYAETISSEKKQDWIIINYDWLIKTLKSLIQMPSIPNEQIYIFRSIYDFLESDYTVFDFYSGVTTAVKAIAKELRGNDNKCDTIKEAIKIDENEFKIFAYNNKSLITEIIEYGFFEVIIDHLSLKFNSIESEIYKNKFNINNWKKYCKEPDGFWTIYLAIEVSKIDADLFNVYFCKNSENLNPALKKQFHNIENKITELVKNKFKKYKLIKKDIHKDRLAECLENTIKEIDSYAHQ